jgi:hypothetical protein
MSARQLSNLFFVLTIVVTTAVLIVRGLADLNSLMSRQTMVLAFPVFMAIMTRKGNRYPRLGALIGGVAVALAGGALILALGA